MALNLPSFFAARLLLAVTLFAGVYPALAETQATVRVDGRLLSINDRDNIAPAMFGIHNTKLTAQQAQMIGIESERYITLQPRAQAQRPGQGVHAWLPKDGVIIECLYDRYQPAWPLIDANWRTKMRRMGKSYGNAVRGNEGQHLIEFWNEPYLNWATRPGVNYDGIYYNIRDAAPDAKVISPFTGKAVDGMKWHRRVRAVDPKTRNVDYVAWRFAPKDLKHGQTYNFRGKTYVGQEGWMVRDTRRAGWWAGPHDLDMYASMLEAFGQSLKETNPDAHLIAGWDFHMYQDSWKAWHHLHRPLLDRTIQYIDGYTEHHYGTDTRQVTLSYEAAWAYAYAKHGKSLGFYCTEAGGMIDPERPGAPQPSATGPRRAIGAMTYTMRDIIYMLAMSPDKARARASHRPLDNGGEIYAFRMLRPLRGKLLHAESSHSRVYAVASMDEDRYVVALFNDSRSNANIQLDLNTPGSTTFANGEIGQVQSSRNGRLGYRNLRFVANGDRLNKRIRIPAQSAAVLTLQLSEPPADAATVHRKQFPAVEVAKPAGRQFTTEIALPEDTDLTKATAAVLQVGLAGNHPTNTTIEVNGVAIPYENQGPITRLKVPIDALKPSNKVTVSGGSRQLFIKTISLFVDF